MSQGIFLSLMRFFLAARHPMKVTCLLTFGCYGCHLPGDQRGSFDRTRGEHRGGSLEPSPALATHAGELMKHPPYVLKLPDAFLFLEAFQEVSLYRGWGLRAAHVRSTHAHAVVDSLAPANRIMGDFKVYASRRLNGIRGEATRWGRGGNVARLSSDESIRAAIRYVAGGQGEAMAVFVANRESPG